MDKNPKTWSIIPINIGLQQNNNNSIKIHNTTQYVTIFISTMIHFLCLDFLDIHQITKYNILGIIKAYSISYTVCFFPIIVDTMLFLTHVIHHPLKLQHYQQQQEQQRSNGSIDIIEYTNNLCSGKAYDVIYIGLKYSFVLYYFGLGNTIVGFISLRTSFEEGCRSSV